MTFKEKWTQEHPGKIFSPYDIDCPSEYGYETKSNDDECEHLDISCQYCWDREMTETKPDTVVKIDTQRPYANATYKVPMEIPVNVSASKNNIDSKLVGLDIQLDDPIIVPNIKDSGDRTQFETGAVRDMREGKGRCDLMPLEVVANCLYKDDNKFDSILYNIRYFMKEHATTYLYNALRDYCEINWGSPYTMLLEVAKHFEEGAKKYGESNWQKGIPVHCYIDSAIRHYLKWCRGDTDEPHDRAFCWNLMCCIWEVDYSPRSGGSDE